MALKTYNSSLVTVSWAGRDLNTGRAESGFVTTEFMVEKTTWQKNAEGGGTRSISNDYSAKITLKVTQQSDAHALIQLLANLDTVGPFEIRDLNGGLRESAAKAWVSKAPSNEFGATAGERVWELTTDHLVRAEDAA